VEHFNLIIDAEVVEETHLVLLKNQDDPTENGVYRFTNRFLVQSEILDSVEDTTYFSVYVKEGINNAGNQFFLERMPNGEYPTVGEELHFVNGKNYVVRNRVDYKLLQDNDYRDSEKFTSRIPELLEHEKFDLSIQISPYTYRVSNEHNWIIRKEDDFRIGKWNAAGTNGTTGYFEPLNTTFRIQTDGTYIYYFDLTQNSSKLYKLDTNNYFSELIYTLDGYTIVDFLLYDSKFYFLFQNETSQTLQIVDAVTFNIENEYTIDYNVREFQIIDSGSTIWFFFVLPDKIIQWHPTNEIGLVSTDEARYCIANYDVPNTEIQISYIEQSKKTPVRLIKDANLIDDYTYWENTNEFLINDTYSKTEHGDWKIENDTLTLKGTNVLNQGTSGFDNIPKVSNTTGRFFDGKDDHVSFGTVGFSNVEDISFEFVITPEAVKTNSRVFYFGSERAVSNIGVLSNDYDSVEFIMSDISTNKPRFQFKVGENDILTIDSTVDIPESERTRITVTLEFNSSTDPANPYFYNGRIWFNDELVGTSSGVFITNLKSIKTLSSSYIARTDNIQDPLYVGEIEEFRISNIILNPAQISARDIPIIETDITWNNLIYYWDLLDQTSRIVDKTENQDGIFYGGLFFDPDLASINNPTQILINSDESLLYILTVNSFEGTNGVAGTSGTSGTSGLIYPTEYLSNVFTIDLRTEDVENIVVEDSEILSIYLESDELYWLVDNKINQYDNIPSTIIRPDAIDFAVVFDKIFWIDSSYQIFDENNTQVFQLVTTLSGTTSISLDLFYGLYQVETVGGQNSYNVYFKDISGRIFIMSNYFDSPSTSTLILRGEYPFYLTDLANSKKGVEYNGIQYYIKNNNTVVEYKDGIQNDLDLDKKYWSWNPNDIFGIDVSNGFVYVGAINHLNQVQIWSYDIFTTRIQLIRFNNKPYIFEVAEDTILDLTTYFNTDTRLFIIDPERSAILSYVIDIDPANQRLYAARINTIVENTLYQVNALNNTTMQYVNLIGNRKYIGLVSTIQSNYTYWENTVQYQEETTRFWIGDFGVVFRQKDTSQLELLQTYVKWNYRKIVLGIDNIINEYNYIVPTWTGKVWIYGDSGNCIRSIDYGDTWKSIITNSFSNLNSANYIQQNGIVIGNNGEILETTSAGEFLDNVIYDTTNVNARDLTDVCIYAPDRALIVGKQGLILHFTFIEGRWRMNNNILNVTVDLVTQGVLENYILPKLVIDNEESRQRTNYNKIIFIDNKFFLFGDRGSITELHLNFTEQYIQPEFKFYQDSNIPEFNIVDAQEFIDIQDNVDKFLILGSNNIMHIFSVVGSQNIPNSNLATTTLERIEINNIDSNINTFFLEKNRQLYLAGSKNSILTTEFQNANMNYRLFDLYPIDVEPNIDDYFKPRMLFTDYYLARKINIFLQEENWIIPKTEILKSDLSCIDGIKPLFYPGEWIEWSATGQNGQPNYLGYQDWFYTTRRLTLLEGVRNQGKVKSFPYNKKFTAVDENDLLNYSWCKSNSILATCSGSLTSNNVLKNEMWNNSEFFPERFRHSMIYVDLVTEINPNDVIELSIKSAGTVIGNTTEYFNTLIEDKFIVKYVEEVNGRKRVVLWDLLDDEILADFNKIIVDGVDNWIIEVSNLNYFDGHLADLDNKLKRHFIGEVYTFEYDIPDIIKTQGIVNQRNKYVNLETTIQLYTRGDEAIASSKFYNCIYPENIIYGPNYNVETFLSRLDPVFSPDYEFEMANFAGTLNAISGEFELDISRNLIYAGSFYSEQLLKIKPGTFVDITLGTDNVKKIYINSVDIIDTETNRVRLSTDTNLDQRFDGNFSTILNIRSRNKLSEISSDLDATDNINFPLPNFNASTSGEAEGSYYHGYFNYLRTATEYSLIIADDENVKNVISGLVWVDEDNDLKLNVYNWADDPNFAFRPIDLHEVGIDAAEDGILAFYDINEYGQLVLDFKSEKEYGLKKAISVYSTNWNIEDNKFGLIGIDFNKYNFILTDGLSLQEVNRSYSWLLNAEIRNAIIGLETVEDSDRIRWYTGDWVCGVWETGGWYSGIAYQIRWLSGDWYATGYTNNYNVYTINENVNDKNLSIWFNGQWSSGTWHNGIWYNGIWYRGNHNAGDWYNGQWLSGEWQSGLWTGGEFFGGTWLDGIWNSDNVESVWHNGTWLGGDFENGIWENGIWDQGAQKISRFGTKSINLQKSIWQFGVWKNGQFHDFLNLDENNQPIASTKYRDSIWNNGIWQGGDWYGGIWESGIWNNGIWHYGLWRSLQQLDRVEKLKQEEIFQEDNDFVKLFVFKESLLHFKTPHRFKYTTEHVDFDQQELADFTRNFVNRITIFGEPNVSSGDLPDLCADLGWNSFPIDHVVKIIDDYTLSVQEFVSGKYVDQEFEGDTIILDNGTNGTSAESSTNGTAGIICIDETLIPPPPQRVELYDTENTYIEGPYAVSHWQNGTWKSGIWEQGYWSNGNWISGIWLDGVWERGIFGA
jgi:hypothetical protein